MCTVILTPGDNPTAVYKYISKHNLSGSHELWHWSPSWKIMMSRSHEVCHWSLPWKIMMSHSHELCHGFPIIREYDLTDVYEICCWSPTGQENRHWLQSRHRTIWGSRNLPLVPNVAEHDMTVTSCCWSLEWHSTAWLMFTNNLV